MIGNIHELYENMAEVLIPETCKNREGRIKFNIINVIVMNVVYRIAY